MLQSWWKSFTSWRAGFFAQFAGTIVTIGAAVFIVAILTGIAGVMFFFSGRDPDCLEDFRIEDPLSHAALFLKQLDVLGLVEVPGPEVSDLGWIYEDGEVRIIIVLDNIAWTAIPCYGSDTLIFLDVEAGPVETGA